MHPTKRGSMKLYLLPPAFEAVLAATEDGELTPEALAKLDSLEMELKDKVDGCCRVMKAFDAQADAYKAEADRLYKHSQMAANQAKRMKEYVDTNLRAIGVEKLETELFKLRYQKNPPSCVVPDGLDPSTLPEAFKVVKIEPNKRAMIDAAKAGQTLPEGITITQATSLRIS